MSLLERLFEALQTFITVQHDMAELKTRLNNVMTQLEVSRERIVALEKDVEYLKRELELREEKIVMNLTHQIERRLPPQS
ncbi:MAG: hypothetical protein HYZ81_06885 [Nitrospinae bacterium]|nr:hypothetical protein [Nitrospinota bacterium]